MPEAGDASGTQSKPIYLVDSMPNATTSAIDAQPEKLFRIGLLPSAFTADVNESQTLTWTELARKVTAPTMRDKKDGPAWLPGCVNRGKRNTTTATPWQVLVLDIDSKDMSAPSPQEVAENLALWGVQAAIATSHSHTPQAPCYRVILPLVRPVAAHEIKPLALAVAQEYLGNTDCVDRAPMDSSRLFYLPSHPPEREQDFFSEIVDGEPINPDTYLNGLAIPDSQEVATTADFEYQDLSSLPSEPPTRRHWNPEQVRRLLRLIDADGDYDSWFPSLAAIHFELGANEGRSVALEWCQTGSKFQSERDFDSRWRSLGQRQGNHMATGALLIKAAYPDGLPRQDDIGNAHRILRRHPRDLMFIPETNQWFRWKEQKWSGVSQVVVEDLGRAVVEDMPADAFLYIDADDRKRYLAHCAKSGARPRWVQAVQAVAAMPQVLTTAPQLDRDPNLLGVKNGAVRLSTGVLIAPDPSLRITMCAGAEYDPYAKCPTFEKVISDVFFDDAEMVSFFRKALGYSLLANPCEELIFIPFGSGANGKSKIFEAVASALGDYAKTASAETLLDSGSFSGSGGAAREDLVRLRGARFLNVAEPEEGAVLREALVKGTTGGDTITARAPYAKSSIEIKPTWCTWMPTNHKPIIKGNDDGIWRRICLIPFTRNFKTDPHIKADLQLSDKLRAELPGILTYLVNAAHDYLRDGLQQPAKVRNASADYRNDMDLLSVWIDECCDVGPDFQESADQLWRSWQRFAADRGLDRFISSSPLLGRKLDQRFPTRRTTTARYRTGIRVRDHYGLF